MQHHNATFSPMDIGLTTKVINYTLFIDLLQQRFSSNSKKEFTALLFINFDNLSQINDTFGFNVSTHLINELTTKLNSFLKSKDILAKVDNNQYIIMQDLSSCSTPEILANDIFHMLSEPFIVNDNMFYMHASIGISLYPLDGNNVHRLIQQAEYAMKAAQNNGRNHMVFNKHSIVSSSYEKSLRIMSDLPVAIENGEIYFLYQPQYSYSEKRFIGAEMLARWIHPKYGEISPALFIPLAEKNGMIIPLTIKALVYASKAFTLLNHEGIDDFSLSVNISPAFLMTSTFYKTIKFLMEQYQLHGENLNFEITEEVLMKNTDYLLNTLEKLQALGINIELDDFGTGYTSLQHLVHLPIDILKIDKSFLSGIDKDLKKKALYKAIVDMAHALNIDVIAEGVETSLENKVLKTFKSIKAQGYFYSKPIPLQALIQILK